MQSFEVEIGKKLRRVNCTESFYGLQLNDYGPLHNQIRSARYG